MKKLGLYSRRLARSRLRHRRLPAPKTIVIKRGGHHHGYGARAEFREHRDHGWHEGWRRHRHADRVVIVKHRRHD